MEKCSQGMAHFGSCGANFVDPSIWSKSLLSNESVAEKKDPIQHQGVRQMLRIDI